MEDDDCSWWYQQNLELQQREEEERIKTCNEAIEKSKELSNAE